MWLMTFIFFLVLLFTVLQNYVKDIAVIIGRNIFRASDEELDLRTKMRDMKDELSHINMIDEFARYMKLQRKIDKIMMQIKDTGSNKQKKMAILNLGVKIGLHVLHVLVMLILVFSNRTEPLLQLQSTYWFFPLNKLVALPTGVTGGVGIVCWIVLCNSVILRGKRLLEL